MQKLDLLKTKYANKLTHIQKTATESGLDLITAKQYEQICELRSAETRK